MPMSIMKSSTSFVLNWTLLAYGLLRQMRHTHAIHCYLCEGDDTSTNHSDSPLVIDGKSCSDLATEAFDVTMDDDFCKEYYQLLGHSSCGCEIIPEKEETQCSLCKYGDLKQTYADKPWFKFSSGSSTTCQDASEYAKRFNETSSECHQFQFGGAAKCGCDTQPQENSCTICQGGEDPPLSMPMETSPLGLTCAQVANGASMFVKDSDECFWTEYIGALLCGCPHELPDEPFCDLCKYGDGVPKSHLQSLYFAEHSNLTCKEMQITTAFLDVYADEGKCKEAQVVADIFCGCQRTEHAPSTTPSLLPSFSPTSQFYVNCPALSSGIVPTSISDDANMNTIDLYASLALNKNYTFASIHDNLLNALQNDVGPLIAGCSKNAEEGSRHLNQNSSNILFVVFKKLEKQGTQKNCPTNQNCLVVKMIIDVAHTENQVEIYENNRVLIQNYDALGRESLPENDEKFPIQKNIERNEMRGLQSQDELYEEKVKRTLVEESESLKVPGLLGLTLINDENTVSALIGMESSGKEKKLPIWAISLVSVVGFLAISAFFAFSLKSRLKAASTAQDGRFIRSDEYFDETKSSPGCYDTTDNSIDDKPTEFSDCESYRDSKSLGQTVAL